MNDKCSIWRTPAKEQLLYSSENENEVICEIDSPRAGGLYRIDYGIQGFGKSVQNERLKARLTTWLIIQREQKVEYPKITYDEIDAARDGQDMSVSQRVNRILQFLGTLRGERPPGSITLDPNPGEGLTDKIKAYYELLAHSESTAWDGDLKFLLDLLEEGKLVRKVHLNGHHYSYILTWLGFERVDEFRKVHPASDQAFVAMWFGNELKPAYTNGFKLAIEDAGYKPKRIDEEQFTDKIDDKIISYIRQSRFIVADFSKGEDGARGGVYYEAGFAHGLGREVIFTCRKEDIEDVHFDTRQYNHIVWDNAEDLRKKLGERITAVMGDGPLKGRRGK